MFYIVKLEKRLSFRKFYFEEPVSWATRARVPGEPGFQRETTNLQTAEGMILTSKDGEIDARGFVRKRQNNRTGLGFFYHLPFG